MLKYVNLWQSPEDRMRKYWLARSLGANPSWARVMRDWRLSALERRLGLEVSDEETTALSEAQCKE